MSIVQQIPFCADTMADEEIPYFHQEYINLFQLNQKEMHDA